MHNTLGWGFLENVYQNALLIELKKPGLIAEKQRNLKVYYDDHIVGDYFADIIVEEKVILELKTCEALNEHHKNQLINYLKATDIEVGLLLNFGKSAQLKRVIFTRHKMRITPNPSEHLIPF